jgi:hypothetical protein
MPAVTVGKIIDAPQPRRRIVEPQMIGRQMSLRPWPLVGLAALAGLGSPAAAQLAEGRSGTSTMSYLRDDEIMGVLSGFGICYAEQNKADAFSLIATQPNSPAETATYRKLFRKPYQSCLGDVVEMRGMAISMIRGAIAEGLYRKKIPIPANLIASVPAVGQIHNLSQASLCYAASHAEQARQLIAGTKPGSRKEYEAVVAMMPDFRRCIPPGASNTQFDVTQIRFRVAEALLRLPASALAPEAGK